MDGREYLITVYHLYERFHKEYIEIKFRGQWIRAAYREIGINRDADVAVLALERTLFGPEMSVMITVEGLTYGQDVYFLGFPFGWGGDVGEFMNGYPLPFIKRATISNMGEGTGADFWLDGINNVGFSGGPIAWGKPSDPLNYRICGLITSYYAQSEIITQQGAETDYRYDVNSGLIVACGIDRAIKLISSNPVGPPLKG